MAQSANKPTKPAKTGVKQTAINKFNKLTEDVSKNIFEPYTPLDGVLPKNHLAMDAVLNNSASAWGYDNGLVGSTFLGYPYLAQLSTISEYRSPCEIIAGELTRKWIKFNSQGEGDFTEQIKEISDALEAFKVRKFFHDAALMEGVFGLSFIKVTLKGENQQLPLIIDKNTIKKGSLKSLHLLDPTFISPLRYNAINPMLPDFYSPTAWAVMGQEVSATRMLKFISRPLPNILRPAFNMGGMSLIQLLIPYVNSWISTRDSVGDLIRIFSITALKTDLSTVLSGGDGQDVVNRAKLFNQTRDSRGLMMLNYDGEDLAQVNTPLSGLDALQAQSAEQMSYPTHIPLIKLLGVTPKGLNASSEGEIKVFYDYIHTLQELLFRENLQNIINIIQLNLYGEIYPEISFEFESLHEVAPDTQANINKTKADTANTYVQMGVVSPEEVRSVLANDIDSEYENLEEGVMPELPKDDSSDSEDKDNEKG